MGSANGGGRVTYKGKEYKAKTVGKNRYEFKVSGKSKTVYIKPKKTP
jgi:hypothetical protein